MNINHNSTQRLKHQNSLFIILFLTLIGLLAFLSTRYVYWSDWTNNGQNSLNEVSLKLLQTLDSPVSIVSYTNQKSIKHSIQELLSRYQQVKTDITLSFVDPNLEPETSRELNLSVDGEMIIHYQGREEHLIELSEQNISNTLYRLLRAKERKIAFIQGHGERSPTQSANFDLSTFSDHLQKLGMQVETLNLAKTMLIPDAVSVLVIAGPQAGFLAAEVSLIIDYVNKGGNLLWLGDPLKNTRPLPMHGLLALSERLGIEFLDGFVVDPSTQEYDIARPDYAIVTDYPQHPLHSGFSTLTLFPQTTGIERLPVFLDENSSNKEFNIEPLLTTVERSWIENSSVIDTVQFNEEEDIAGPISIAMVLTRTLTQTLKRDSNNESSAQEPHVKEQRIIVIGDGDFLSNTFLGNGGNLTLGVNIFNWLSHDDQFIAIPTRIKDDIILDLSPSALALLGAVFLFVMPGLLIVSGSLIWSRRRHR